MTDLRNVILDVIREDEEQIKRWLVPGAKRTHAFLGRRDYRMKDPPAFSRRGNNELAPCILYRVYSRLYPHAMADVQVQRPLEEHPWFELYGIDCCFLKDLRGNHGGPYPVEWEYDWLIEVENNLLEFTMHLRGLLDFVANHRLGIFFCDDPDKEIVRLTTEFRRAWNLFAVKCSFANALALQAVFFPQAYATFQDFSNGSRTYVWNAEGQMFQRLQEQR